MTLPLVGSDTVSLRGFARDLTYREVHSLTAGFAPIFMAVVLAGLEIGPSVLATAVLAASLGLSMAALGEKEIKNAALKYIVKEPHYFLGGQVLGMLAAIGTLVLSPLIPGLAPTVAVVAGAVL